MVHRIGLSVIVVALSASLMLAAGCGGSASEQADATQLGLVAYSTPREAYAKLIPLFQSSEAGKEVAFVESYGSSGEQTRAVQAGLDADVVALSLAPDMEALVAAGKVDPSWSEGPHGGMVTNSVVVFVVRDGNPKDITSWDDLLRPGVEIVTPNPFTSGGARWNIMAAYGAWREQGATDEQARDKLLELWKNVVVQDTSARASLSTFNSGKGDVLLAYENEALFARKQGLDLEYVVPQQTILIENPIAVTTGAKNPAAADAFLDFLRTPEAQQVFADDGYRSVLDEVQARNRKAFPVLPGLFTIDDLGGWEDVQAVFFDPETGVMAGFQREVGGSTS